MLVELTLVLLTHVTRTNVSKVKLTLADVSKLNQLVLVKLTPVNFSRTRTLLVVKSG